MSLPAIVSHVAPGQKKKHGIRCILSRGLVESRSFDDGWVLSRCDALRFVLADFFHYNLSPPCDVRESAAEGRVANLPHWNLVLQNFDFFMATLRCHHHEIVGK